MKISNDSMVVIDYTLTDDEGKIIDSTDGNQPLSYIHGQGMLIPGLEKILEGKTAPEKIQATIAPEEAYGVWDEKLLEVVPHTEFTGIDKIEVGMQFQSQSPDGHLQIVTVKKIEGENVTIDTNHPLAGANLNFDVTIREVREATEEDWKQFTHSCDCEDGSCENHHDDDHECCNTEGKDDNHSCGCGH